MLIIKKYDEIRGGQTNFMSPGLVVMEGDSCSKGCEFESQHRKLDGHFFTFICCKNCNVIFLP